MVANPATNTDMPAAAERRRHHRVRAVFEEALVLIAPFFEHDDDWGHGTLDHLAYRALREAFPQLSVTEVHVLVIAAQRVYGSRTSASADSTG
ncbi:MAG TPA: hypothetical protein PL143_20350 [Rhodocyclaceae bacterium]|nr:hypothetical protein [Rhodocyclaceae bacterium]